MADNVTLDPGAGGAVIAADDVTSVFYQRVKLDAGGDGASTPVLGGGGVEASALRVTIANDSTGLVSVDDNGGSLTVDNATISVVGSGTEATAQRVTIATDSTGVLSVDDNGGSLTVDGTVSITANSAVNVAQVAGTATSVNSGTKDAGTQRVILASDQHALPITDNSGSLTVDNGGTFVVQENGAALTALQLLDNTIFVDDAAYTPGTSSVSAIGMLADQASTDSVNEGDIGIPRITLTRQQITTPAPSVDTEGATIHMNIDVDETEDAVKASAGKILGWYIYNDESTEFYVKFYNDTVANVVVGTTVPVLTIPIPAGSGSNIDWSGMGGIPFSAAITIACTDAATTAGTTGPGANKVIANVLYV
jgi:hypothetical protein